MAASVILLVCFLSLHSVFDVGVAGISPQRDSDRGLGFPWPRGIPRSNPMWKRFWNHFSREKIAALRVSIDPRKGPCFLYDYYDYEERGKYRCALGLKWDMSRAACCCRHGQSWGDPCKPCPPVNSTEYNTLCPGGPGPHFKTNDLSYGVSGYDQCMLSEGLCQGGTCVNTFFSYTCDCPPGFTLDIYSRTCNGTCGLPSFRPEPRTGCAPGDDLANPPGVTLQACADACCNDSRCLSFQYNVHNQCYLKSKLCSAGEKHFTLAGNMYDRIDLPGPKKWREDFQCGQGYPAEDGSPAECDPDGITPCCSPGKWCGNTAAHCDCPTCVDYRNIQSGTCGLPSFRPEPRTGCAPGDDLANPPGVTLQACADACCNDSRCLSFQYNVHNQCYLKSKLCSVGEKHFTLAGNMYDRMDLPGTTVPPTTTSQPTTTTTETQGHRGQDRGPTQGWLGHDLGQG
ncbi:fibrillin-3-like isoform X1 [Branchiostoma lanceolatum]|uniref:fibrillin-3-like isoform X1 n=1 Tax=Branchiostoma lanceolatum TaxID=7740 RepID=UPI003456EED4